MASLRKLRNLKASILSSSLCKGDCLPRGRLMSFYDEEMICPLFTRAASAAGSGSISSAVSHSSSRRSYGYSFSAMSWSSRIEAAGQKFSRFRLIGHQSLLPRAAFSRAFAIYAIHCILRQSCRYKSFRVATVWSGSNIGKRPEAGSNLLTDQSLGGVCSRNERTIAPKQAADAISKLQQLPNEHELWDAHTQINRDRVVDVEAFAYVPNVSKLPDSRTLFFKGIYGFREDSEVEECADEDHSLLQRTVLDKVSQEGLLEVQKVSSLSVGHFSFDPVSLESVLEDTYGSFAGTQSSGFKFPECHGLCCSEDLSRIIDNDGVQHTNLRLLSGACCLPHPNKSKTGGEDAYFICSEEQVVGVADGVGGWADVGIDAGNYSRELMLQSKLSVAQEPHGYINPARVLMRAHAKTKCRGSSTACIIGLSDHGIQAANLGDSGFILIRNGRSIFKSPVQQHQFNIPFQLESGGSDPPSSAEVFALQVAAGDVLVAGTDGLFDNLYDNELMGIVIHSTRAGLVPQVTAQKIAALARLRAEDCNRQTPFSTAAQEAGFRFYGGKMDDITVIVSYVTTSKRGFLHPL